VHYDEQSLQELRAVTDNNGRLAAMPFGAVATRLNALAVVRRRLTDLAPLLELDAAPPRGGFLLHELRASRERVPPGAFTGLFRALVDAARRHNSGSIPSVTVNRGTVPAAQRRRHNTVFCQIFRQVGRRPVGPP
jgi:hypothetical protein